jgi:hypothetical protein
MKLPRKRFPCCRIAKEQAFVLLRLQVTRFSGTSASRKVVRRGARNRRANEGSTLIRSRPLALPEAVTIPSATSPNCAKAFPVLGKPYNFRASFEETYSQPFFQSLHGAADRRLRQSKSFTGTHKTPGFQHRCEGADTREKP